MGKRQLVNTTRTNKQTNKSSETEKGTEKGKLQKKKNFNKLLNIFRAHITEVNVVELIRTINCIKGLYICTVKWLNTSNYKHFSTNI